MVLSAATYEGVMRNVTNVEPIDRQLLIMFLREEL